MRRALQQLAQEPGGFEKDKRDFWYLYRRKLLPDETREYVPKVLAAALIGSNPSALRSRAGPVVHDKKRGLDLDPPLKKGGGALPRGRTLRWRR